GVDRSPGRSAHPHPQRPAGQEGQRDDPGVEAARARPRRARARRLYSRLFGRSVGQAQGLAHRAQIFRGPSGDPACVPRVEARPPCIFGFDRSAAGPQRLGHHHRVHASRCFERRGSARPECRRRSAGGGIL
ncbi:MAG: SSU ribosomal protein S8p (S15Ae), partial [uncultured Sphingomonadaceae bacterium]